jgi:hypothetical protein
MSVRLTSATSRALAAIVAVMVSLYGVLPQVHLAWGHEHALASAIHQACGDERLHLTPTEPVHPDCPLCQDFLAAPTLAMPSPLPAVIVPLPPVERVAQLQHANVVAGVLIRWSLARGPPQA